MNHLKIILIAFSLQQWFQECASLLRYTHVVFFSFDKNTVLKTTRVMLLIAYTHHSLRS